MGRMKKSRKSLIAEGRGMGVGKDFKPLYMVEEARSDGCGMRINDPIEGRTIHTMSHTETLVYYHIRGNPEVKHIYEQCRLNNDRVRQAARDLKIPYSGTDLTTDFLVEFKNGEKRALFVKYSRDLFNKNSSRYKGRSGAFTSLIKRVKIEKKYWEKLGVRFRIVTREKLNVFYATNIMTLLRAWREQEDPNEDMKTYYLIAHGVIITDLYHQYLNPKKIREELEIDINALYEDCIASEERRKTWLRDI